MKSPYDEQVEASVHDIELAYQGLQDRIREGDLDRVHVCALNLAAVAIELAQAT
jgi:hypothetical protein